jgi:DNA-binding CsgD family transcriptional regulator/tetratricopeptide (TPR) repeat protein
MLEIVAVAGDATDRVIRLVADDSAALRALVVGGLITEQPAGRQVVYRVTHPLYAEVAYAELTIGERRKLHAALLTAIEETTPDDVLTLAPHYQEAGSLADPVRAVEIMAEAGWRALAMSTADEAIRYLTAAAELAGPSRVPALLDGVGRAQQSLGQYDEALGSWRKGMQLAARSGMIDDAGGLQLQVLRLEAERSDSKAANDRLHDLAQRLSVSSHEAAFRYFEHTLRHNAEGGTREATALLTGFAGPGQPPESQSVGYLGEGFRLLLELRHHEAVRVMETAVAHARRYESEYPLYARITRLMLTFARALTGDVRGSLRDITESLAMPTFVDIPSLRCFELYGLAFVTYLSGDLTAALAHIEAGVATAVQGRVPRSIGRCLGLKAFLLAELGRLGEAKTTLAEAKQAYLAPDMSLSTIFAFVDAVLTYHQGGPSSPDPFEPYSTFADPLSGTLRPLFTSLTALADGDGDLVAGMIPDLRAASPRDGLMMAFADRLDGLLAKDPDAVSAAADRLDAIGAPLLAMQARLEWAELTGGREIVQRCVEVFDKAGAAPWSDRARQHARSLGIRVVPARSTGVLTNRESQVVRLLGDGLSNADIAARLYLSERTVETHLRNTYAKLGLTSRVALARWAGENLR